LHGAKIVGSLQSAVLSLQFFVIFDVSAKGLSHAQFGFQLPNFLFNFTEQMRPDYPHKIFPDFRNHFFLLMETLAMDGTPAPCLG